MPELRVRPSARLLLVNKHHQVLLFHFVHHDDALAGRAYWATPGGGLEDGESFEHAAIRELWEETGIKREDVGACIAQSTFTMTLPSGEQVTAEERFYRVVAQDNEISSVAWTENEKAVIGAYHWWAIEELKQTTETVYPANLVSMLSVLLAHD